MSKSLVALMHIEGIGQLRSELDSETEMLFRKRKTFQHEDAGIQYSFAKESFVKFVESQRREENACPERG